MKSRNIQRAERRGFGREVGRSITAIQLGMDMLKFSSLIPKLFPKTENQMIKTIGLKHYMHGTGPEHGMFGIVPVDDMPGENNFISIWMKPVLQDVYKHTIRSFTVMAHVTCPVNPALLPERESDEPWNYPHPDNITRSLNTATVQQTFGGYQPTTHMSLHDAFFEVRRKFNLHLKLVTDLHLENLTPSEDVVDSEAEFFGCSEEEYHLLWFPLWSRAYHSEYYDSFRHAVRMTFMQGGSGRDMRERGERRGRPEQADDVSFVHALPMVCWEDVLGLVTDGWFPSHPLGVRQRAEDTEQRVESVKRARID